uniref:SUF system FeS cluster assembly SufBD core domain-containing protein n=1 Tax=Chaetoceros debilis TaxID=122233 RepID=A0A7S3VGU0_9STRA|mmetsp:Transcript_3785/g.5660  ORF Transcript_3785/g.5660 Transcript_3785/m.5660 type:complete len:664 (-) Transcript_3785:51-2042(-)
MKVNNSVLSTFFALIATKEASSFAPLIQPATFHHTSLRAIGLGPSEDEVAESESKVEEKEKEPIVEPDHESFRESRLSDFDKKCDEWYGNILKSNDPSFLGKVSEEALRAINTLVKLEKVEDNSLQGDEDWSPYKTEILPGSPILPSYGLEQYGLPTPRRNAEAWRQFDVTGLVGTDYSGISAGTGSDIALDEAQVEQYTKALKLQGAWLEDDECDGRLVYVNGKFAPSLSIVTDKASNLSGDDLTNEMVEYMTRLPDGFTDRLAADVPSGETDFLTSMKSLSGPNHNVGEPTSQFSINNQQGTACFVALNSVRAGSVASVNVPEGIECKPIIVVNAITSDGNFEGSEEKGVAMHPRTLATAGDNSSLSLIQAYVDLEGKYSSAKFVNGCTQIFVGAEAKVKHSYLEETGGLVTGGVEAGSNEEEVGVEPPRVVESKRSALKDTHFECVDVHVTGDNGSYEGTIMGIGGNGRSRIAVSTTLLRPGSHAGINGFSLCGGAQRTDMRTNIHHIGQATTSKQSQKNMVAGRATATFKGRIRVEQSAQQTDSEQLARTILLSDKARVNAIPSLEIIADDVTCTHGATVSDLSEEELFYLRSRGVDRGMARNILMYGFVDEISSCVDKSIQGKKDDPISLRNRVIQRLENVVSKGERQNYVGDEFQSV